MSPRASACPQPLRLGKLATGAFVAYAEKRTIEVLSNLPSEERAPLMRQRCFRGGRSSSWFAETCRSSRTEAPAGHLPCELVSAGEPFSMDVIVAVDRLHLVLSAGD